MYVNPAEKKKCNPAQHPSRERKSPKTPKRAHTVTITIRTQQRARVHARTHCTSAHTHTHTHTHAHALTRAHTHTPCPHAPVPPWGPSSSPSYGSPSPWLLCVRGPMPHADLAQLLCSYSTASLLSSSPSPNAAGSILGLIGLMLDMLDGLPWSRDGEFRSPDAEFLASPASAQALISSSSFCTRVRTRDDDAAARRPCAKGRRAQQTRMTTQAFSKLCYVSCVHG